MYNSNHERFQFAEQLYCFTEKTIPEIAELTGIPKTTLYDRARLYNWQTLRRASRRSPAIIVEEMYQELSDLTASVHSRPVGQRRPTPEEAELRRKILCSIAIVKKFPTHAKVAFIMQSLLRYIKFSTAHHVEFAKVIESFLAHRDFYGFASYQPEHDQDLNMADEHEMHLMFTSPDSPYNQEDPDDARHELDRGQGAKKRSGHPSAPNDGPKPAIGNDLDS